MFPVKKKIKKDKYKPQPIIKTNIPILSQFEAAYNIISNIENINIQGINNMIEETLNITELNDILTYLTAPGYCSLKEKIKGISEFSEELKTLIGVKNIINSSIDKINHAFLNNVLIEYPSKKNLFNSNKIKENIKIKLGIKNKEMSSMSDN